MSKLSPYSLIALAFLCPALAQAQTKQALQSPEPQFGEEVRVGFGEIDSRFKMGLWTPVEITIVGGAKNTSGVVVLSVPDGNGVPANVSRVVQVAARTPTSVRFISRFGRDSEEVRVTYVWEDSSGEKGRVSRSLESGLKPLQMGQQMILSVGASVGVEDALKQRTNYWPEDLLPHVAGLFNADQLPQRWYGYEGVDLLILPTSQPRLFDQMTDAQVEAIDEWVRQGGHLLMCGGASAEAISPGARLARFVPGTYEKPHQLNRAQALENFTGDGGTPLFPTPETRITTAMLRDVKGRIVAQEGDLPLVIHSPYGMGEVSFVTADLDQQIFLQWKDLPKFYQRLLDWPITEVKRSESDGYSGRLMSHSISDISSHLRHALDDFPGVRLVPFGLVATLILLYILLIGPGDYFLVKKVFKRMEYTWITFPVSVLVISFGAYWLASALKGTQLRINQAAIIDVDVQNDSIRGTAWMNIFSPQTDRYNLSLAPSVATAEPPPSRVIFTWLGLPEDALGGMGGSGSTWGGSGYQMDVDADLLEELPIQVWSTKALTARWSQQDISLATGKLVSSGDVLREGSVMHHLNAPLSDCFLAYGASLYDIGEMKPDQPYEIDLATLRDLKGRMQGTTLQYDVEHISHYRPSQYDVTNSDIYNVLEKMMFFKQIEGKQYTGLDHSFQSFVDLSHLLRDGQAILVGRCEKPGSQIMNNGTSLGGDVQAWTYYRFVFPVSTAGKN